MTDILLPISYTLSISYNYLLVIIYKLVTICMGCYTTVTTLTNKDSQLSLYYISIKFHLTLFILTHTLLTHVLTWASKSFIFKVPPSCPLNKRNSQSDVRDLGAHLVHIHHDMGLLQILVSTFGVHRRGNIPRSLFFSPMVSTQSSLKRETPFKGFNPPPTTTTDTDTLQQLQNRITEMEWRHEEELRKLKADHNQLEAHIRRP